jgi:hypothetical protein
MERRAGAVSMCIGTRKNMAITGIEDIARPVSLAASGLDVENVNFEKGAADIVVRSRAEP